MTALETVKSIVEKYNGTHTSLYHSNMWAELEKVGIGGEMLDVREQTLPCGTIRRVSEFQDLNGNATNIVLVTNKVPCSFSPVLADYSMYVTSN